MQADTAAIQLFTHWLSGRWDMINCVKIDLLTYTHTQFNSTSYICERINNHINLPYTAGMNTFMWLFWLLHFNFIDFLKNSKNRRTQIKSINWGDSYDSRGPPTGWVNSVTAGGRTNDWFRLWFVVDANTITFVQHSWENMCGIWWGFRKCVCVCLVWPLRYHAVLKRTVLYVTISISTSRIWNCQWQCVFDPSFSQWDFRILAFRYEKGHHHFHIHSALNFSIAHICVLRI